MQVKPRPEKEPLGVLSLNEIISIFTSFGITPTAMEDSYVFVRKSHVDEVKDPGAAPLNSSVKHVKLLNGLALLLVTRKSEDVAAISVKQELERSVVKTTFVVAKNGPCPEQERVYHEEFLDVLRDGSKSNTDKIRLLRDLVIVNCKPKMMDRARKLQSAAEAWKALPYREDVTPPVEDIRWFREYLGARRETKRPWQTFILSWIRKTFAKDSFAPDAPLSSAAKALNDADIFCSKESLVKSFEDLPSLQSAMRKMGAYLNTIGKITQLLDQQKLARTFSIEYVPTPALVEIPPMDSPMTRINRFVIASKFLKVNPVTMGILKRKGLDTVEKEYKPKTFKAIVHAEAALAVHMFNSKHSPGPIEIGVSTKCCWACLNLLHAMTNEDGELYIGASHYKAYEKWAFPSSCGPVSDRLTVARRRMLVLAEEQLSNWLHESTLLNTSDSDRDSSDPESEPVMQYPIAKADRSNSPFSDSESDTF